MRGDARRRGDSEATGRAAVGANRGARRRRAPRGRGGAKNPAALQTRGEPERGRPERDVEHRGQRAAADGDVGAVEDPDDQDPHHPQLAAKPATVKNSSGRRGSGARNSTSTAARLVPGRRPLNTPRTSASILMTRVAASGAAVDAGRARTARMPGATR